VHHNELRGKVKLWLDALVSNGAIKSWHVDVSRATELIDKDLVSNEGALRLLDQWHWVHVESDTLTNDISMGFWWIFCPLEDLPLALAKFQVSQESLSLLFSMRRYQSFVMERIEKCR
jgi:hypothetical protein